jgi:hypothetical protein
LSVIGILTPFRNVSRHIMESEGVGAKGSDGRVNHMTVHDSYFALSRKLRPLFSERVIRQIDSTVKSVGVHTRPPDGLGSGPSGVLPLGFVRKT